MWILRSSSGRSASLVVAEDPVKVLAGDYPVYPFGAPAPVVLIVSFKFGIIPIAVNFVTPATVAGVGGCRCCADLGIVDLRIDHHGGVRRGHDDVNILRKSGIMEAAESRLKKSPDLWLMVEDLIVLVLGEEVSGEILYLADRGGNVLLQDLGVGVQLPLVVADLGPGNDLIIEALDSLDQLRERRLGVINLPLEGLPPDGGFDCLRSGPGPRPSYIGAWRLESLDLSSEICDSPAPVLYELRDGIVQPYRRICGIKSSNVWEVSPGLGQVVCEAGKKLLGLKDVMVSDQELLGVTLAAGEGICVPLLESGEAGARHDGSGMETDQGLVSRV